MIVPVRPKSPAASATSKAVRSPLFRGPAVEAVRYGRFGPVNVVTPAPAAATLAVAVCAIACAGASLVLIEMPERARAIGALLPAGGLIKVRAVQAGTVRRLAVQNGSVVAAGDSILWIGNTDAAPARTPLAERRLSSMQRELDATTAVLHADVTTALARRDALRRQLLLLDERLRLAQNEADVRRQRAEVERRQAARVSALAADGRLSRHAADDALVSSLAAVADREMAKQRVLAIEAELAALRMEFESQSLQAERLRAMGAARRESLNREIAESELQSVAEVRAPAPGIVAGLAVRTGGRVTPGQVLLTLYAPDDSLEARLYVAADSAGFLHVGQSIELRLRAYPHRHYGTVAATITEVGAVAVRAEEIEVPVPIAGPVFEIRADVEAPALVARGQAWPLPPGTAFEADLVRGRWPLYAWLFRGVRDRQPGRR